MSPEVPVELDDLKAAWTEIDRRVESVEALVRADYRARRFSPARRALRFLGLGQAVQMAVGVVMVVLVAPFWFAHRDVPSVLVAGLALHAYGVLTMGAAVVQILAIGRTYYAAPVVECQTRVARLRRLRIICSLAVGLPWWVLWVAVIIIAAQAFAGVDLYPTMPAWILWNVVFGLVAMALSIWFARRMADRADRPRWIQGLADHLAGRSLRRVAAELQDIRAFERD